MPNKFWNFVANKDNTAELNLYGEIMSEQPWYSEDNVTYRQFIEELTNLGSRDTITVHINSGGGDVFAAHAIFTRLKMNSAKIIAHIEGICASAATIVAAAADIIKAAPNVLIMYHNNTVGLYGFYSSDELVKLAEINQTVKQSIIESYKTKYDKTEEELNELMDKEEWMTGRQALEQGYVDELLFQEVAFEMKSKGVVFVNNATTKQSTVFKSDNFKNFPTNFLNKTVQTDFINKTSKKGNSGKMDINSVDDLKAEYPDFVNQIITEAASNAVNGERKRLQEIDKLSGAVPVEVLNKAKYEEPSSAENVAYQVMMANSAAGASFLNGMKDDLNNSGADGVGGDTPPATPEDKQKAKVSNLAGFLNKDKRRTK